MDLWGSGASSAAEPSDVSFPQTESDRKADRKPCELTRMRWAPPTPHPLDGAACPSQVVRKRPQKNQGPFTLPLFSQPREARAASPREVQTAARAGACQSGAGAGVRGVRLGS